MKNKLSFKLLEKLSKIHSVTGDTEGMKNFILRELDDIGVEYFVNRFGTIIVGDPRNSKVMFSAHIDQVGFQITKVFEDGTCSILPIGWVFPNRFDHSAVYVKTKKGIFHGGIYHKSNLKSENIEKFSELFLYLGFNSKEELEKNGIVPGVFGSFKKEYWETDSAIFSSSIDNAVSIFSLLTILKTSKNFLDNACIAFHDDEEMQNHAGNGIGYEYTVEYCCVLDYFPSNHMMSNEDVVPKIGEGPMIVYRAGSHILHPVLREKLDDLNIFKAFISSQTIPSVEPQNFQNNGTTKAFNYCISALGYHGEVYSVQKNEIYKFIDLLPEIKKILNS
ncbi:MAG: hypothetical protein KatS3mg085_088 [Candidatus Dojkabacteria bacterium]|nr:MAG: hypothetical protein KatS3mg085_088 [Candidatus Dojkabacteria bacterium]